GQQASVLPQLRGNVEGVLEEAIGSPPGIRLARMTARDEPSDSIRVVLIDGSKSERFLAVKEVIEAALADARLPNHVVHPGSRVAVAKHHFFRCADELVSSVDRGLRPGRPQCPRSIRATLSCHHA